MATILERLLERAGDAEDDDAIAALEALKEACGSYVEWRQARAELYEQEEETGHAEFFDSDDDGIRLLDGIAELFEEGQVDEEEAEEAAELAAARQALNDAAEARAEIALARAELDRREREVDEWNANALATIKELC